MENVKRIKCSCGNRFVVTKNDAYNVEVDFSGPDVYYYKCPECGKHHLICAFEFRQPTLLQSMFWFKKIKTMTNRYGI